MTGVVVWITGLPGSGKTTLARRVQERLVGAVVLDGDVLRGVIGADGYGPADRDRFYDLLARLAALIACQGVVVLVPATAHERRFRERARRLAPRFVEVWVRTPRVLCEARDPKGLYARARGGDLSGLPGVDLEYEQPMAADVTADGGEDDGAVARIMETVAASPPARPQRSVPSARPAG